MPVGEFGHCCKSCQLFWTCDTKWFRGEKEEQDTCCSKCHYYNKCLAKSKEKKNK